MSSIFDREFHTLADWPALAEQAAGQQVTFNAREATLKAGYAAITRRFARQRKRCC